MGAAIVDGAGSTWTNSTTISLGQTSTAVGRLSISNGGNITSAGLSINNLSTLTTDVGKGSSLSVGTGTLTNNGTVRLVAGAAAANGTYTPITAGTWTGSGSVQALGGVLNSDHSVTVNVAATGAAESANTIDLSTTQRVLLTDYATNKSVGASFQAGSGSLTLTSSATTGTELSSLQALLDPGKSVLSGWDFSISGTAISSSNPLYLSLYAGDATSLSDLMVWSYNGTAWSAFTASDLAYDKLYASFTVTDLNSYAVTGTAPVPIPGAVWLLGSGLVGLGLIRRNRMTEDRGQRAEISNDQQLRTIKPGASLPGA